MNFEFQREEKRAGSLHWEQYCHRGQGIGCCSGQMSIQHRSPRARNSCQALPTRCALSAIVAPPHEIAMFRMPCLDLHTRSRGPEWDRTREVPYAI